ncbi:hypothetical protein [Streptomyces flaveolus]|uniref:hypothetical protein n=1 Tax=Streptomyces flaveolus TaxID=67297 RepID=UPI00341E5ABF
MTRAAVLITVGRGAEGHRPTTEEVMTAAHEESAVHVDPAQALAALRAHRSDDARP